MKFIRAMLLVLACAVLLVLGTLQPSSATPGDYGVRTTGSLYIGGTGAPASCATESMTSNWSQIMEESGSRSYKNTWNWINNYNNARYSLGNFVTRFQDSVTSTAGTGWAVSQASEFDVYNTSDTEFNTFHKMVRIWAFDPDTTFTVTNGALQANKTIYYTDYFLNPNAGCRWQAWNYAEVGTTAIDFAYNKVLFVNAASISYPNDYSGLAIPSMPPSATYVAMGDSFSSGEGNPPFIEGTDESGVNECHRSSQAYPSILDSDPALDLGAMTFVACSGATTDDVLSGKWDEDPQIDALTADTEVVTITVGGNDVGFKDFATACTLGLCNFSTTAYSDIQDKISQDLPAKLDDVYAAIDSATSSTAKIYVVGYPQIAPEQMPTGMGNACWPLNGQQDNPDPSLNDGATTYSVVEQLNSTISAAVQARESSKFEYIDPNAQNSPFESHDWCQQDRYFDIVTLNNIEYSFHPNTAGQNAYATIVKEDMN